MLVRRSTTRKSENNKIIKQVKINASLTKSSEVKEYTKVLSSNTSSMNAASDVDNKDV